MRILFYNGVNFVHTLTGDAIRKVSYPDETNDLTKFTFDPCLKVVTIFKNNIMVTYSNVSFKVNNDMVGFAFRLTPDQDTAAGFVLQVSREFALANIERVYCVPYEDTVAADDTTIIANGYTF